MEKMMLLQVMGLPGCPMQMEPMANHTMEIFIGEDHERKQQKNLWLCQGQQ